MNKKSGMRFLYKSDFNGVEHSHYGVSIDDWPLIDDECLKMGDRFHEIAPNTHEDCEIHDRFVGAALLIADKNPEKACAFYNKWALITGYMPVKIESLDPLIIDNFEFKIRVNPLEVLCQ